MRKALAALLLFFASVSAALAQQSVIVPATTASVAIVGAVNATTVLAVGKSGQSIFVTAVDLVPAATAVVQFYQSTAANCSVVTANLTGSLVFSAGQTYMKGDGYGTFWVLAPGNTLCANIGTALAPGSLAYAQF